MSNTLIKEGLRALREQWGENFKRDETGRLKKGPVARKSRLVRDEIRRSEHLGPEDFNWKMLYALDPDKFNKFIHNPPDSFSSDEGQRVRPFKGMNRDPDYYMKFPESPFIPPNYFPNLETGVERKQRRFPDAPTMAPLDPVVRDRDFSADDFKKYKNHAKQRTYYDI